MPLASDRLPKSRKRTPKSPAKVWSATNNHQRTIYRRQELRWWFCICFLGRGACGQDRCFPSCGKVAGTCNEVVFHGLVLGQQSVVAKLQCCGNNNAHVRFLKRLINASLGNLQDIEAKVHYCVLTLRPIYNLVDQALVPYNEYPLMRL